MREQDTITSELYDKLSRFAGITMLTHTGTTTVNTDEAVIFQFEYGSNRADPGIITVSLMDPGCVELVFSKDLLKNMDEDGKSRWYQFIDELRDFAITRFLGWKVSDVTKARFDKNDFDFMRQNSDEYSHDDITMESKMYGSKRRSYHEGANKTRLIVKHSKPVQEEVKGARSRNIKTIHIENAQGERFLMPRNHMPTARAMARHVANEGTTTDAIGTHIVEMFDEMTQLRTFNRKYRNSDNMMEGAEDILEATKDQYRHIKQTLESLQKQSGYAKFVETFEAPAILETDLEEDYSDLKEKLTRHTFNEDDEELLPTVKKAFTDLENRKAEKFQQDSEDNIARREDYIENMTVLPLTGSEQDDTEAMKIINGIFAEHNAKKYSSPADRQEAKRATTFRALTVFKDRVLSRIPSQLAHQTTSKETDPTTSANTDLVGLLNAVSGLDFTYGKDDFMTQGHQVDPADEKMGRKLFTLWSKGKIQYVDQVERQTESDVFEAWADKIVEFGEQEFTRDNEYEAVANELMDYAYSIGNTHSDYPSIKELAELLHDDRFDDAGEVVRNMDQDTQDTVSEFMDRNYLTTKFESWLDDVVDESSSDKPTDGYFKHMKKVNKGEKSKYPNRGKGKSIDKDKFFGKKDKVKESIPGNLERFEQTFDRNDIAKIKADRWEDDSALVDKLMDYYMEEMPYGTQKARDGDPYEFIYQELDDLGLFQDETAQFGESELDEASLSDYFSGSNKPSKQLLAKLVNVINSVQTPEQFDSARTYAGRAYDQMSEPMTIRSGMKLFYQVESAIRAKATELGIDLPAGDIFRDNPYDRKPSQNQQPSFGDGDGVVGETAEPCEKCGKADCECEDCHCETNEPFDYYESVQSLTKLAGIK